ncbi:DEAD/DEAH box helicase [Pseudazoarcus pumilus]|uniref:DEAD-box ATP-dependent RNA helicase RhpA n=1 Tax=Pseudazoarcus pumilus TaxID=2067960 RepID=A0A2I6S8J1_9RHOO|nr:DEAD/DEAH box helicase [Pseudazoarcus pumilus]AUN95589.1 DEAD/DEAH box helicase [Pseudazoarcus pumilus]
MSFADLGLIPELQRAVSETGYTEPTPIQQQAIPVVLSGLDMMGAAQTGTGKTAGFTLPLIQRLARHASTSTSPARHPVRALVLAPTRELAVQVHESVETYGKYVPLRSICIYGGVDMRGQIEALRRGVEIVVATPGRLLDHVQQKTIQLGQVEILVLDEADRMLDMGFIPDIRRILDLLPAQRQSLLFSATFSEEIKKLADRMLKNPTLVEVARRNMVSETIEHRVHPVSAGLKRNLLAHLLRHEPDAQALIFVDTKLLCGRLAHYLTRQGISADAIHGDKSQGQRTETLEAFKSGRLRVLVATDVAARGLDVDDLPLVINFELPHTAEDYVHRIGRTGRAGRSGNAISLVCAEEKGRLAEIQKLIGLDIPQEVVPGFDPEPDYDEVGTHKRKHRDAAPRASAAKATAPTPAAAPAAAAPTAAPRRSGGDARPTRGRRDKRVAADGFDFSKPYAPASEDNAAPTVDDRSSGRRDKRPVAVLLGGLGRK